MPNKFYLDEENEDTTMNDDMENNDANIDEEDKDGIEAGIGDDEEDDDASF